jgi:hypothetical protein
VRFLAISCSCCLFLLLLGVTTSGALATTKPKHGCAPAIPPPVSAPLVPPAAIAGQLFLNEVLLTPHSIWNCSDVGAYTKATDSWIELYNAQDQALDLAVVHTSIDSGPNTNPLFLHSGTAIAAHSFLVIFPFTDPSFFQTATSTLRLLINNVPVDEVTLPTLAPDQSYARIPDGSTTWQITDTPTIDSSNMPIIGAGNGTGGKSGASPQAITPDSTAASQDDGIQPTWTTMHLPTATAISPVLTPMPSVPSPAQQQITQNGDISHKIILTLLAVAFALILLWCWKLFSSS